MPQSLYPAAIAVLSPFNNYTVNSGSLWAFPFVVIAGSTIQITTIHTAIGLEDFSLRAWVSRDLGGAECKVIPNEMNWWSLKRIGGNIITIFDQTSFGQTNISKPCIPVSPGNYYVNILNLINLSNTFIFTIQTDVMPQQLSSVSIVSSQGNIT